MNKKYVVHFKKSDFDVYVGRPSKWGNPFSHKENTLAKINVHSLDDSIELHKEWILNNQDMIEEIKSELKGKILGCWCYPNKCHADILAQIANEDDEVIKF